VFILRIVLVQRRVFYIFLARVSARLDFVARFDITAAGKNGERDG
jgi:hypothetical protein